MHIVCVHHFGFWFGYVLNSRRRVVHCTPAFSSEFLARRHASHVLLQREGRTA